MSEEPKRVINEISIKSVLKMVLLFFVLWLLFLIRDVLIILLIVAIISVALEPFVVKLEQDRIPRAVSIIVLYLVLLAVLGLVLYFVIPPVALQLKELALNLPYVSNQISNFSIGDASQITSFLGTISQKLSEVAGGVIGAIFSVFGGIVYAITIFALTFYALVDSDGVRKTIASLIPTSKKDKLLSTINKVSIKLGDWLRGQLLLMLIMGFTSGVIFQLLGIKYALTLGLLAGFLEIVPVVGPILTALIAVAVAFAAGSPLWTLAAIVIAQIILHQVEGNILVPKIMQKAIGLSPLIIIIALLIGNRLLGLGGAILAIPVAAGIQVFIQEYFPLATK